MATVNPWKRFIGLLPGGVRTVATVISINPTAGISEVELRTGTRVTVRGVDVPVSGKAYSTRAGHSTRSHSCKPSQGSHSVHEAGRA